MGRVRHAATEQFGDRLTGEEFDRILAAHDAEVAAKALLDAADAWSQGQWANVPRISDQVRERLNTANYVGDWLRERANQIGEGK